METVKRANYIGAPQFFHLNNLCSILNEAYGYHNYHVGSSLTRRDFRDVDIRCIMSDEEFERLFPGGGNHYLNNARWSLTCAAISEWLSMRSGLSVDWQIQKQSEANTEEGPRSAIGLFVRATSETKEAQR